MLAEPYNVTALTVRGNAYVAKGDFEHALDDYTAAISFEPSFALVYHQRGVAYRMMGDREHAIDDFKMAVRLLPKDSPDSRAELKALGIELPMPQPSGLTPLGKNLLDQLK